MKNLTKAQKILIVLSMRDCRKAEIKQPIFGECFTGLILYPKHMCSLQKIVGSFFRYCCAKY
jgi:hypothetical protein